MLRSLLAILFSFFLCPLSFCLHPANVAVAQAKVAPDGTFTTRIRFDLTAFVTGSAPKEADDKAMNAFLDGSDDAMHAALVDAQSRFRAEFAFGGTIDRLAFPTVADVRAFLATNPLPRLPAMLTATVEGHLPPNARTIAFRYPNAFGTVIQTVEFPYQEPYSEPVDPGHTSTTLTIPTPEQVAKLAAEINAPRREEPGVSPSKRVPFAATGPRSKIRTPSIASGRENREGGGVNAIPANPSKRKSDLRASTEVAKELPRKPARNETKTITTTNLANPSAPTPSTQKQTPPASFPPTTSLPPQPLTSSPFPTIAASRIATYLRMGFTHILPEGLDHILFVLGLFLLGSNTKALLKQITAFTVAHSLTLALATLNLVHLPGRIIEPLIAFSIAFVAVENLVSKEPNRWRTAIVFLFGLVHGMGFAEVFRDAGLTGRSLLTALVSFNFGVEAGQLTVVALALLAVGWFRSNARYRSVIVVPTSLVIAGVALVWTVQRIAA